MMMMLVHRFHQLRPTLTPAATTSLAAAETTFFEIRSAMISLWNRQERERERETEIMSVPFFLPSFYETMESFSTVVGQEKRHLVFVVVVVSFPFLLSDVFLLFRFFFLLPTTRSAESETSGCLDRNNRNKRASHLAFFFSIQNEEMLRRSVMTVQW